MTLTLRGEHLPDEAGNLPDLLTVTAEHGTGKTRKKYMDLQFSPEVIEIMKGIKRTFDPNGILNPGVIVDL